jgi:hypothetical protein
MFEEQSCPRRSGLGAALPSHRLLSAVCPLGAVCARAIRIGIVALAMIGPVHADDSSSGSSEDPALTAANLKTKLAQAEADLLKAQNDAFKNKLGAISADYLQKGTITPTSLSIEGRMLAYRAAGKIAEQIATAVQTASPTSIVMYSEKDLLALAEYQAFTMQVSVLEDNLKKLSEPTVSLPLPAEPRPCPGPTVSPAVAPLVVAESALALLGLFKTDITVTGQEVTLDDFGVTSLVASQLLAKKMKVIYPPSYYPNVFSKAQSVTPNVYARLKDLRTSLQQKIDKFTPIKSELDKRLESSKCKSFWRPDAKRVDEFLAELQKTASIVGDAMAALMKADATSGVPKLATYVRAEQIAAGATDQAFVLQIKPITAGGNSQVAKNIFYSTLSFSGGATISYMLFKPSGEVAQANTVSWYGGYVKAGDLSQGPMQ